MSQTCVRCGSARVSMTGVRNPHTFSKNCIASFRCGSCGHSWESQAESPRSKAIKKRPGELPLLAARIRKSK